MVCVAFVTANPEAAIVGVLKISTKLKGKPSARVSFLIYSQGWHLQGYRKKTLAQVFSRLAKKKRHPL